MNKSTLLQNLRSKWSTNKYHIEYNHFLSNHLNHGVIALHELGATEAQIEEFAQGYINNKPMEDPLESQTGKYFETFEEAKPYQGKREHFYGLLSFYEKEIQSNGADKTLAAYLPNLLKGTSGSLFHGIIHLGYGYKAQSEKMIAEGIAYLHHSSLDFSLPSDRERDCIESSTLPSLSIRTFMDALENVRKDGALREYMQQGLEQEPLKSLAYPKGTQKQIMTMSYHPLYKADGAIEKIDEYFSGVNLETLNSTMVLDALFYMVNSAYRTHQWTNFVYLHGVTSAWSIRNMEHLLSEEDRRFAWKVFLRSMIAAYVSESEIDLVDIKLDTLKARDDVEETVWEKLAAQSFLDLHRDEHVYKLVQVANDFSTSTSNAEPGMLTIDQRKEICMQVAENVLNGPLGFFRKTGYVSV